MWNKYFNKVLTVSIVLVYIVIIAGSVVRMTGSGMGCPDWPKCFGYIIPPTAISQLDWKANHKYEKGQKIIKNESIFEVKKDFVSQKVYNSANWKKFTKHDYAVFNPIHTWIEYINRLATVVFGIPLVILFVLSFFKWREDKRILFFSGITLLCVGIEAVLGKIVVDTNLQPVKITLHVLFVFFIIAFLLTNLFITKKYKPLSKRNTVVNRLGLLAIFVTLLQVTIGTLVRQYIDVQMQINSHLNPSNWLANPPIVFYIHRSFSIIVVLINICWIWLCLKKINLGLKQLNWIVVILILEVLTGIILYYLDFPFLSQPTHLLLSSLLFSVQFYAVLRLTKQ